MDDSQVLVVGAGPGGAALALLLASRGVDTLLVERQSDFEREFRGEAMMPSGLDVLGAVGVELAMIPHSRPARFRVYRAGRPFLDLRTDDDPDVRQPRMVSQPHLLEHLVDLGQREPAFRFLRGASVRDLLQEDGRVCGVRLQTREGEREIRADLVVGADGRASVVRRRGGFAVETRGAPMDVVWFKLPWPPFFADREVRAYIGGGHLLIALPAPDGLLQVAWVILKGTYGELRRRGVEEWAHAMADHVDPELGPYLQARAGDVSRPFLLDAETDRVRGWALPGVVLIGDAAHTMSPVGGQGLNLALRDAIVAANHLVPVLGRGGSAQAVDAAAARIEEERGPEIDRIQALAALPPRVVLGTRLYHSWARWLISKVAGSALGRRRAAPVADLFFEGVSPVKLRV